MRSVATEKTTEVVMPQMGVSVAEGTIAAWLKRAGDRVEVDEPICEVTTDKIDVEIPSPAAGLLMETLVEEGTTVAVGTAIATIGSAGQNGGRPTTETPSPPAGRSTQPAGGEEIDRSSFHSPVVRRIAADQDVDLADVEGHGIGGRVRKTDLLAYLGRRDAGGRPDKGAGRPLHTESPYRPEGSERPEGPCDGERMDLAGPQHREAMDPMRRAIANHMVASRRTSAHCTTVVETDFSAVTSALDARSSGATRRGVKLTYLAFVAYATVGALQRHPILNASIQEDEIVYHEDINLGIAVALDDGLIVPVIRQAQRLSVEGLAAAIGDLAVKARAGDLMPDDVAGGTFTITNPGQFGAVMATPIINQPQVAILDLEAVIRRPVAIEDGDGREAIAIRPMSYLCMSWDHRATDGVEAARFLADVRAGIESGGR